jgi:uncharacterized membrane protein
LQKCFLEQLKTLEDYAFAGRAGKMAFLPTALGLRQDDPIMARPRKIAVLVTSKKMRFYDMSVEISLLLPLYMILFGTLRALVPNFGRVVPQTVRWRDPLIKAKRKLTMQQEKRNMLGWVILWAIAAVIMIAIDMVWLMWLGRGFYMQEIGDLLLDKPNLLPALAFYLLYSIGVTVIVIAPAMETQSVLKALGFGVLFGLVAYGTYDLTNLAVMKGFTTKIALIDMVWGGLITGFVSAVTVKLASLLNL